MTIVLTYPLTECEHEYPDDWEFGGATGLDPRADPRWLPTTYEYLDKGFRRVAIMQTPICDHAAVAEREVLARRFPSMPVLFITAARPPDGKLEMVYSDTEAATGVK